MHTPGHEHRLDREYAGSRSLAPGADGRVLLGGCPCYHAGERRDRTHRDSHRLLQKDHPCYAPHDDPLKRKPAPESVSLSVTTPIHVHLYEVISLILSVKE